MRAFILAAGLGTRLKPITDRIPKALLPIGGKTLLEWQVEKLKAAGITDITINIHHLADQIVDFCHEHDDFGCTIQFSDEREALLETGGGLKKAQALLTHHHSNFQIQNSNEPILVLNVDVLSNIDIRQTIEAYRPEYLAMLVVRERKTQRYLVFDEHDDMIGWTNIATGEKKGPYADPNSTFNIQNSPTLLAFSGMHIINPRIFERMEDYPERFSITDFYIDQCGTEKIHAYTPSNYRLLDVGKIDQLAEAEAFAQSLG